MPNTNHSQFHNFFGCEEVEDFSIVKNELLIASKMLMGMAKELSYRLRLTNLEVRTLEE